MVAVAAREASDATVAADFELIIRREFGYVWKTLERLGIAARDLEDVAQDVFVAVYNHLSDYDPSRPIRPWLCAFCYRLASTHRNLARHRYERMPEPSAIDRAHAPGTVGSVEARDLVLRALHEVEVERRVVFLLHDVDGHDMPDIARELGLPLNTAYSRLRLARGEFRRAVERLQGTGGAP